MGPQYKRQNCTNPSLPTGDRNIYLYIDSKQAFTTLHVHGVLCKEKGLIGGKDKSMIKISLNSSMLCGPLKKGQSCIVENLQGETPRSLGETTKQTREQTLGLLKE